MLADLAEPLASVAPGFVVGQRSVGGSLFRIQRNTRFSHDKSPYNDWLGARFLREGALPDQTGELFMRVAADGRSEVGAGIVFPSPGTLAQIRDGIVDPSTGWSAVEASMKAAGYKFIGRSLQRGPRGFEVDHPRIEALKRQSCAVAINLTDRQICSDELLAHLLESCRQLLPLVVWQHRMLGFVPK